MSTLKIFLLGSLVSSFAIAAVNQSSSTKVIYGEDDRVEPFTVTDQKMLEVSNAVAAMISASNITIKTPDVSKEPARSNTSRWGRGETPAPVPRGNEVIIKAPTLTERGVCASERFNDQMTAANCSGFLVADDILVTAGHCIKSQSACNSYKWVFGYQVGADGKLAKITEDDVYDCKEILGRELSNSTMGDFAVIRLNKKVTNRKPMKLNIAGKPVVADEVVVLGHPTGLPQKIAGGAVVKKLDNNFFFSNLDTYGGNSGSAVINARTYEVEGILVRGRTDYINSPTGSCTISNVLPDDTTTPEEISFISQVFSTLGINNIAYL